MDSKYKEIFVGVPWGKMAVLVFGEKDDTPVVMLHGNQDSAGTFFPLIKFFPKHLRLILPELPGCGKSSPFPAGHPLHIMDFVHPLKIIIDHFQLQKFTFIGHSMGMQVGLLYNAVYSGNITRIIALDHVAYPPVEAASFQMWYRLLYENFFEPSNHKKFIAGVESGPKYTYEKALSIVMNNRQLTKTAGEAVLKRTLIPIGDGLYRFCWDQRFKIVAVPIFSAQYQLEVFGNINIPHLTILATESVDKKLKDVRTHLINAHKIKNPHYRIVMIEGNHDVHLNKPELVAKYAVPFLNGRDLNKKDSHELVDKLKDILQREEANQKSKL